VKNNTEMPSLLPYLDSAGAKLYLRFSFFPQAPSAQGKSRFPFLVIDDSNPLGRLLEAQFVTDAESDIKRVFILLQKDEYLFATDELWPVNNPDVDQCWQEAFSFYSKKAQNSSVTVLSDQIGKDGGLLPLQPLFFCRVRQTFFHPLCPECGTPVQQCYDDELLGGLGLQPFSTSLKRYLFCPSCSSSGREACFYAFSLETSDPPMVKDRWDLIRGFGLLTEGKSHMGAFPCTECPNQHECFVSDGLAASRIVPLSFYPFHMLIFEAMSLSALDFLSLVSGASLEDLESRLHERQQLGRISCLRGLKRDGLANAPFFFGRNERHFLEVLYLKLSFLGEVVQTVFSGLGMYQHPALGLSVDRIWVKLTDQGSLLPFLWNFKVKVIDVGADGAKRPFLPKYPPWYGLHFLGLFWFYALVVNKRQRVSEVYMALAQAMERVSSNAEVTLDILLTDELNRVSSWENILWNREGHQEQPLTEDGVRLWRACLGLGWSLLNASLRGDPAWSREGFWQELENLREEIKDSLFRQGSTVGLAEPTAEDKAIHEIIVRLMDKWRVSSEAKEDRAQEVDLEETIVISTTQREALEERAAVSQDEEDVEETIILSPEDFSRRSSLPREISQPSETTESDIPETVVMRPSQGASASLRSFDPLPPKAVGFEKGATSLEEAPDKFREGKMTPEESEGDDFLAQTVVLRPDRGKGKE